MNIYFAGCARDCADVISSNISSILALGDNLPFFNISVFVAENGSNDCTRTVIANLAEQDERVIPIFLDDLDQEIPVREARIAYCRDRLLAEIINQSSDGLYVPIDLDSNIASSLEAHSFQGACELVASSKAVGIFPSSFPYYYDIYALRERDWCPASCWKQIHDARPRGALWKLLVYINYISSRQKSSSCLYSKDLIPVDSAFGGVAVYSLGNVIASGACYSSPELVDEGLMLCEHVVFNRPLKPLYIKPDWVISAPLEHIDLPLMSAFGIAWRIAQAALHDVSKFALRLALCFRKSF